MQPPSLPISQPIKSTKAATAATASTQQQNSAVTPTGEAPAPPSDGATTPTRRGSGGTPAAAPECEKIKHDLLVWFEILELASSGEYVPVLVDRSDDLPCRGMYYLHHGLQRRIRITLIHSTTRDLRWRDVKELVVGRIRVTPDCDPEDLAGDGLDGGGSVLSLGLFPGEYLEPAQAGEGRTMFRFEAAWDSSLHNSLLLNRVTPAGETVYMTISAYLEVRSMCHVMWQFLYVHTHCRWTMLARPPL